MPVKKLFDIVIGGGNVNTEYKADPGEPGSFTLATGSALKECWYVPVDNLTNLAYFDHIEVTVGEITDDDIILKIVPNQTALLRIFIYGEGDYL